MEGKKNVIFLFIFIREHEALRIWMAAGKISRINNAWLVRSLNYLAKNVKINGLVSYWRLRDFALNQ